MSKYNKVSQSPLKSPDPQVRPSFLMPLANNFLELTPQRSSRKAGLFSNDQELFFDFGSPLIMVSENNILTPSCRPSGRFMPPSNHRTINDERIETESRRTEGGSKPRLSVWSNPGEDSSVSASVTGRKARLSQLSNSQGFLKTKGAGDGLDKSVALDNSEAVDIFKTEEEEKEENPFKMKLKAILDSTSYSVIVGIFILYALFADDLRELAFKPDVDLGIDIIFFIALGVFSFEIVITLITNKEYLWSFFFWLDILSTISIVFDIEFISDDVFPSEAQNTAQLARASRASRIGTKAGRVVRIFRLVRLTKFYKQVDKNQKEKDLLMRSPSLEQVNDQEDENIHIDSAKVAPSDMRVPTRSLTKKPTLRMQKTLRSMKSLKTLKRSQSGTNVMPEDLDEETLKESRVGKKLADLTTKRVIIIVLALLLIIPFFSSDFYFSDPASVDYDVNMLNIILSDTRVSDAAKQVAIQKFMSQQSGATPTLVYLKIGDSVLFPNADNSGAYNVDDLRNDDKDVATATGGTEGEITSIVTDYSTSKLESGLNMIRTVFICFILVLASLLFTRDANVLVLRPIERMIEKVNKIARNPLIAKEQALVRDRNNGLENETIQIENAIIKIGGLLALGYGDAGSSIVAQNMARSGDLNPMLPGHKEMAIFGFCDIRNFTDATEVLQEEVMVFVNSIADVVHSVVDLYSGAANKNIGDAFLLVWKFPEGEVTENDDMSLEVRDSKLVQAMADLALLSFVKINIRINRDPVLLAYRSNPALNARLPNYQVKMGFGLHVGWAIEGAIGSEFKVDASYLSPNVNMASRLEAATKQYGVPLLFSGELYNKLSKGLKQKCRLIDIVTVKGSVVPMELYTIDMNVEEMLPICNRDDLTKQEKREIQKFKKRKLWEGVMERNSVSVLENDKELLHAFRYHNPEFNDIFEEGFRGYIQGDWAIAKKKFEQCLTIHKEDGPTKNLLGFLKENDYIAPEDWKGFHVLTEK